MDVLHSSSFFLCLKRKYRTTSLFYYYLEHNVSVSYMYKQRPDGLYRSKTIKQSSVHTHTYTNTFSHTQTYNEQSIKQQTRSKHSRKGKRSIKRLSPRLLFALHYYPITNRCISSMAPAQSDIHTQTGIYTHTHTIQHSFSQVLFTTHINNLFLFVLHNLTT